MLPPSRLDRAISALVEVALVIAQAVFLVALTVLFVVLVYALGR